MCRQLLCAIPVQSASSCCDLVQHKCCTFPVKQAQVKWPRTSIPLGILAHTRRFGGAGMEGKLGWESWSALKIPFKYGWRNQGSLELGGRKSLERIPYLHFLWRCFPSFSLAPTEKRPKLYLQFCFVTLDKAFRSSLSSFPMYKVGIFIEAESEGDSGSTPSTLFQDGSSFIHVISESLFLRAGNCSWKATNELVWSCFETFGFFIAGMFFLGFIPSHASSRVCIMALNKALSTAGIYLRTSTVKSNTLESTCRKQYL